MSRIVRRPVTLFGFAFLLLLLPIWWRFCRPPVLPLLAQGPAHAQDFEVKAIRAGLDANALAAAGVSGASTTSLMHSVDQYLLAHPAELTSADSAYANALVESDRLQRLIQSGLGTEQDVTTYQSQSAALSTSTVQRDAALDAIFNTGAAGLTQGQRLALSKIRANRNWNLAIEFMTVDRSEPEWVNLRGTLAYERISGQDGVSLDPEAQAQLATWRADPTVAAAATSLGTNLSAVTAAWNAATHD
jgi:hypothetical protein